MTKANLTNKGLNKTILMTGTNIAQYNLPPTKLSYTWGRGARLTIIHTVWLIQLEESKSSHKLRGLKTLPLFLQFRLQNY